MSEMTIKTTRVLGTILTSLILTALSLPAMAQLIGRLETSPGTGVFQAYYDDVLDISWLADANLADTERFAVSGIATSGSMRWATVDAWITAMNNDGGIGWLGINTWRAPTLSPVGGSATFNTTFSNLGDTDVGYNIHAGWTPGDNWVGGSEMSYMFYQHLGGVPNCNPDADNPGGCDDFNLTPGITTTEPFQNVEGGFYWSGLAYDASKAWAFDTVNGNQTGISKTAFRGFVWAVADGDVAVVHAPVPAAVYLFGSGLLGMIALARRKRITSGGVATG